MLMYYYSKVPNKRSQRQCLFVMEQLPPLSFVNFHIFKYSVNQFYQASKTESWKFFKIEQVL